MCTLTVFFVGLALGQALADVGCDGSHSPVPTPTPEPTPTLRPEIQVAHETKKITASDPAYGEFFGSPVSLSGMY